MDATPEGQRVDVEIRPLAEEEIALVERHLDLDWGAPHKHRQRLDKQRDGKAVYLIAWHERLPIGHALLKWGGPDHDSIASRLDRCADIEDLFVNPAYRSRGVGSQLLGCAESLAGQRQYSLIGLGVDVDNPQARSLYQRRGYEDTAFGEYRTRWQYIGKNGQKQWTQETCNYLVRDLGG